MDKNLEEVPLLIGQTGPLKGENWVLNKPITIGREPTCEVVIPDRQVSHVHARLTPTSAGIVLEDLGSKNGIHRNGSPVVGRVTLQDGDILQIALAQQFLFLSSDATMPLIDSRESTGRLHLDVKSHKVWVNNQIIDPPLSALQFQALRVLSEQQGRMVARHQLVNDVWGEEEAIGVTDQALDALLRRLRDRIAEIDPANSYIVTIRGHGIRLDNPQSSFD
jgi:DNA-binding winged helix-turn-helix (wHTH) protein